MVQNYEEKVRIAFAKRLNKALDKVSEAPKDHGRALWLGKKMLGSNKAAGKWLNGETMPETAKFPRLAEIAHCDGAALLFGTSDGIAEAKAHYKMRDCDQSARIYEQLAKLERDKKITSQLIKAIEAVINAAAPMSALPAESTNYTIIGYKEPADLGLGDDAQLVDLTDHLQKAVEALQNFRARRQPPPAAEVINK